MATKEKVPIPVNGEVVLDENNVPIGSYWGTKGPGKYEFLIDSLHVRSTYGHDGAPHFKIAGVDVNIRIMGVKKMEPGQCPAIPTEMVHDRDLNLCGDDIRDWADPWELVGYVPHCAVGVLGVYSTRTRIGRYDLWDQFTQTYTCEVVQQDLATFFLSGKADGSAEALLQRALHHITKGSHVIGGMTVQCADCWEVYRRLRQSASV